MGKIQIRYKLDDICSLEFGGGDLYGDMCEVLNWPANQDISNKFLYLTEQLSIEIVYYADLQPTLIVGLSAPTGTDIEVSGEFNKSGHLIMTFADPETNEYDEPTITEFVRAGGVKQWERVFKLSSNE